MKKALSLLAALIISAASYAADTKPIEDVFNRYWAAFSKKDLAKAATDVMPADLEELRKEVLPVFLASQTPKDKEAQEIVGLFFGKTVGKAREAMTGVDVYTGLNRILMAGNPQMFDLLKDAAISIIFVRNVVPDEAEVHFQVTIRAESDIEEEALGKKDGRWWIRIKGNAKDTAEQFKILLAGRPAAAQPAPMLPKK